MKRPTVPPRATTGMGRGTRETREPQAGARRGGGARALSTSERRRRELELLDGQQVRAEREPRGANPGAVQRQKVSSGKRFNAWRAHHSTTAISSLAKLFATPVQSLMTWMVIAIGVALPAALFVLFDNVQKIGYSWQDTSRISVYLKPAMGEQDAQTLRLKWSQRMDVDSVTYISPSVGLNEFKQTSGLGDLIDQLKTNPLPGVLLVQPKLDRSPDQIEALQKALAQENAVDEVQLDLQWVKRLHQFIDLSRHFVMGLTVLLALAVLLILGNTIRMAIEARIDEIRVVKLVGATDAYVRRPFLYTGFWYGLGGGIIAALILAFGFHWLATPVADLAKLYESDFRLVGLDFIGSIQLILIAGLAGLIGAWIAVARHLYAIQPK